MNTAIAAMMSFLNEVSDVGSITRGELKTLLILLNPFAPHMTEEVWELCKFGGMVYQQKWPTYDEAKCADNTVEIAVQVCGKLRGRVTIPTGCAKEEALATAKAIPEVARAIEGKTIVKEIVVPDKLVNLVVK
jgi:leucyl-tRNA synthetase